MNNIKKGAEEAKQLNQQVKSGNKTSFVNSTDLNSSELQEARHLNSQSGGLGSSFSSSFAINSDFLNSGTLEAKQLNQQSASESTSFSNSASSLGSSELEEAKQLNQQSRQNKGKQ
jgi:hypothetical protein